MNLPLPVANKVPNAERPGAGGGGSGVGFKSDE